MKKIFLRFTFIVLTAAFLLSLAACKDKSDNCEHVFGEWQTSIEATCTTNGVKIRSCEKCGKGFSDTIPCGHTVAEVVSDRYLLTPACTGRAVYYKSCTICGASLNSTFEYGEAGKHRFSGESTADRYLKTPATCSARAVYYKYCTYCGERSDETFEYGKIAAHCYEGECEDDEYLKAKADCVNKAVYYNSCIWCGKASKTDTFLGSACLGHSFSPDSSECARCDATLDVFNGNYGYEFLGTTQKGAAMQSLYGAIDTAVKKFHTDTNLDAEFNGENYFLTTVDFSDSGLSDEEALSVWKTYKDDKPLYYWLSNSVTCSGAEMTLLVNDEYYTGAKRAEYNEIIYSGINALTLRTGQNEGAYRLALAYHNAVIDAVNYAYDDSNEAQGEDWAHNIVGVFARRGAVCEGYARSFQLLLNCAGVENVLVTGISNGENHAWNLAKMDDGEWYWFDLTYDDANAQAFIVRGNLGRRYNNFCIPESDFNNHEFATSQGVGIDFLYDLPTRAIGKFDGKKYLKLGDEFTVGNMELYVVGYNEAGLKFLDGEGAVTVPESVRYGGHKYEIVSIGVDGDGRRVAFSEGVEEINFSKAVKFFWDTSIDVNLKNVTVDEDNPYYTTVDGVLFTKSLYTLILYPPMKPQTEYVIPDETVNVDRYAFMYSKNLEKLTLGKNVETVSIVNFFGAGYADGEATSFGIGHITSGGMQSIVDALKGDGILEIHAENQNYINDGVGIYDREMTCLWAIVDKSITTYHVSADLRLIETTSTAGTVFWDCEKLEAFTVDENNETFTEVDGVLYKKDDKSLFCAPRGKIGVVHIPDGVEKIGREDLFGVTFDSCKSITGVELPDSVKVIGHSAFSYCTALEIMYLPNGVEFIGYGAFSDCYKLKKVTIPVTVTKIEDFAFHNCFDLQTVVYKGTVAQWNAIEKDDDWYGAEKNFKVQCTDGTV